jgi:diguanylate cyclase (GGDEF)-like protein/PAS domain S-box-containing protein
MKQHATLDQGKTLMQLLALVLVGQAAAMLVTELVLDDLAGWAEEVADIALASLLILPLLWWGTGAHRSAHPLARLAHLALVIVLAQCVAIGLTFVIDPGAEGELAEEMVDLAASALVTTPLLWLTLGIERSGGGDTPARLGSGASPHRRMRWVLHGTLAAMALLFGVGLTIAWQGEQRRDGENEIVALAERQGEAWHALDEALDHAQPALVAPALAKALDIGAALEPKIAEELAEESEQHTPEAVAALRAWQTGFLAWRDAARRGPGAPALSHAAVHENLALSDRLLAAARGMRNQHADETIESLARVCVLGAVALLALGLGVVEPLTRRVRGVHERLARQAADFERLALVAESTANAVLIVNRDATLAWANAALQRMTGRGPQQTLGAPAIEALQPDAQAREDWAALLLQLEVGNSVRRTLACHHADGRRLWIDADLQPRWGEAGAIDGFLVVATDVTESVSQRERLRALLDALPAGVVELDAQGRVVEANRAAQRSFDRSRAQLLRQPITGPGWRWLADDMKPFDEQRLPTTLALRAGLSLRGVNLAVSTPDDELRWLLMNCEPLADAGALACFVDVTEQRAERTMLRVALDANRIGTWEWRLDVGEWAWSEQACAQIGYSRAELAPMLAHWRDRIHPDDRPRVRTLLRSHFEDATQAFDTELRIRHRDGHWVWIHVAGAVVERTPLGKARRMVGIHVDISARMQQAEAARLSALTDTLTGLHNRGALVERLQRAIERRLDDPASHFALLFLDLDRFKQVNDTLGHSAGDEMLRIVAQRLRAELRPADEVSRLESSVTAARLGGDEFVIALDGLRSARRRRRRGRARAARLQPALPPGRARGLDVGQHRRGDLRVGPC